MDRVFISSKGTATFICPQCQKAKTVDVSSYASSDQKVKVNVKCPCGHSYRAILEKRKQYRKKTNLSGTYTHIVDGRKVGKGWMTVRDISATGFKLELNSETALSVGDHLVVEFYLDDAQRTLITKRVVIRNIRDRSVGTEFSPTETVGKALGFYLLN
jgi:PilZ domain